jgi:hypothetical protein
MEVFMRYIALFFVVFLTVLPAPSGADTHETPRITAAMETKSLATLSPEEDRAVSLAAGRILKHVNQARVALAGKDAKGAKHHVEQGILLVRILEATLPKYTVKMRIAAGQLVYEDHGEEQPLFVPIYDGLEKVSILAPVEAAKEETAKESQSGGAPVVAGVNLIKTRASLDVALTRAGLETAATALKEEKKTGEADAALALVQRGVIMKHLKIDLPLEQARANLWLAKELVIESKHKEAQTALREATDALEAHEKGADESHARESRELRKQISQLATSIETESQGAIEKIMGWWEQLTNWST